jgi:hypothetical protein
MLSTQTKSSSGWRSDEGGEQNQMTNYQILLNGTAPLEIAAARVNLGMKKLCFYDDEDHLLALFTWDHVIDLQVVGSAKEQTFTDVLLHEKKQRADELAERERNKGVFLATAETLRKKLQKVNTDLSGAWLKLTDSRKSAETASMIKSRASEFCQSRDQIIEEQKSIEAKISLILSGFKDVSPLS